MTVDEQVEEAERVLRRLEQLPGAVAELLVTELRTCRRVLQEIRKRAAPGSDIHALAAAALEEPSELPSAPSEEPRRWPVAPPAPPPRRVIPSPARRAARGSSRGAANPPRAGLLPGV